MNEISLHEFFLLQDVYLHTRVAQDELHFYSYDEVNAANYVGT